MQALINCHNPGEDAASTCVFQSFLFNGVGTYLNMEQVHGVWRSDSVLRTLYLIAGMPYFSRKRGNHEGCKGSWISRIWVCMHLDIPYTVVRHKLRPIN